MQEKLDNSLKRLDVFIAQSEQITRNAAAKLIKQGFVMVDEKLINKPSFLISPSNKFKLLCDKKQDKDILYKKSDFDFDIEILYEDEAICVVNKPSGVVTHRALSVKEPTLDCWLQAHDYVLFELSGERKSGLVHRIDKGTSGALMVAKTKQAFLSLASQLADKSMGRYYLALIDLPLKESKIINEMPIGRALNNRLKRQCYDYSLNTSRSKRGIPKDTKSAKSEFVELINNSPSLIAAKLFTGRTHQIRAHLQYLNRHILGDDMYGFKGPKSRVCLHAYLLYFTHPSTGEKMLIKAPIPEDLEIILNKYFNQGLINEKILPSSLLKHFA